MARPTLPLLLSLAALSLGAAGADGLAVYALLAAIPPAAASALDVFGGLVELPEGESGRALARVEAGAAFLGLLLVVAVAASRSPAAVAAPLGESAIVAAALLFGLAAAAGATRSAALGVEPRVLPSAAPERDARAA